MVLDWMVIVRGCQKSSVFIIITSIVMAVFRLGTDNFSGEAGSRCAAG